jgi:transposase-like protein
MKKQVNMSTKPDMQEVEERIALINVMIKKGYTMRAIADHIGICPETLSRWVTKHMRDTGRLDGYKKKH